MIRTIIVDDEVHAREELAAMLDETGVFRLVGSCANAVEALKELKLERPEVMFLDIRMPGPSGFDLLSMIDEEFMPIVVFVTAYDEYAVKAFDENAFDYLLKPVEPERLCKTVEKLQKMIALDDRPTYPTTTIERIPCVSSQRIKLIARADVDYVKSDISGVYVVTSNGEFYTDLTLKVLESRADLFRCHKQFLVNLDRVDEILIQENQCAEVLLVSGKTVPVSRRFFKKMKGHVGI